jgi:hypothetical protein
MDKNMNKGMNTKLEGLDLAIEAVREKKAVFVADMDKARLQENHIRYEHAKAQVSAATEILAKLGKVIADATPKKS